MYNLGELAEKVSQIVQRSEDTDFLAKIKIWLQLGHKQLGQVYDYWTELESIYNFSATDGRETYPLPNNFDKPLRLYDLTSKNKLVFITEEEYSDNSISDISTSKEGMPIYARIFGISGLNTEISTSGKTVQVKSSSSSDSGGIRVHIEGYVDSSLLLLDCEDIVIDTGTPTDYVAGTKTFYGIPQTSKSANTTGYITIADSDGTVLGYIAPNERVSRHKILKFGPIPDSTYSMRLLFKKIPPEMTSDYDYPFTECDNYLILNAVGYCQKYEGKDAQAEYTWRQATDAMMTLISNQNNRIGPDYQHKIVSDFMQLHRC